MEGWCRDEGAADLMALTLVADSVRLTPVTTGITRDGTVYLSVPSLVDPRRRQLVSHRLLLARLGRES